jgi:hypothetical protein
MYKLSYDDICERMKRFDNCDILSYDGMMVEFRCNIHNTIDKVSKYKIHERKDICWECSKHSNSQKHIIYTMVDIDKILNKKSIVRLEEYKGYHRKMRVRCNECGREWRTNIACLIGKDTGCGMCNTKERMVYKILSSKFGDKLSHHHAIHKNEKEWIVVDFFLKDKNVIIEYNGIQHYKPARFGGCSEQSALINFDKQVTRDTYLREYCKEYSIRLIEIPYIVPISKIQSEICPVDNEDDIIEKLSDIASVVI